MVSHAVLDLCPRTAAPQPTSEVHSRLTSASQLTKNLITNASFKTKKLEGDIPRIDGDETLRGGNL